MALRMHVLRCSSQRHDSAFGSRTTRLGDSSHDRSNSLSSMYSYCSHLRPQIYNANTLTKVQTPSPTHLTSPTCPLRPNISNPTSASHHPIPLPLPCPPSPFAPPSSQKRLLVPKQSKRGRATHKPTWGATRRTGMPNRVFHLPSLHSYFILT